MRGRHGSELYDLADLYDVAYDWDTTRELVFYLECFEQFGGREPRHVLEPACGTGRNLETLARLGCRATGYDINPATLEYARKRMEQAGLAGWARLLPGNMADFRLPERFDGAFLSINSFRYLVDDREIASHLRNTRAMLRKKGVYIIDFSYGMPEGLEPIECHWQNHRQDLELEIRWTTREFPERRISEETCTVTETRSGQPPRVHTTLHHTRLWTEDAFLRMIDECGFELRGVLDMEQEPIANEVPLDGRLENLYHILQRVD